ncbi:unnamed protein product, partial [Rhizoctonia solani]
SPLHHHKTTTASRTLAKGVEGLLVASCASLTWRKPRLLAMQVEKGVAKRPKRLVVGLTYTGSASIFYPMIQTDRHNPLQLVSRHYIPQFKLDEPSLLDRLAAQLRLNKGNKQPVDKAVAEGYDFVSRNYIPGDQVVLVARPRYKEDPDLYVEAAETLARQLHNGTGPSDCSNLKPINGGEAETKRIPIHGVAVIGMYSVSQSERIKVWFQTQLASSESKVDSMSEWSDELKSRFPLGTEHIICNKWEDGKEHACWTRFGPDGGIISRQIFLCTDSLGWDMWIHCTKHVIYYKEDWIPEWDKHEPVWTREPSSSPSGSGDTIMAEGMKPEGMHRHELRKYEDLPGAISLLVWKWS